MAPAYLSSDIQRYVSLREGQRSADLGLLKKNGPTKPSKYGERSFSIYAPILWETLPVDLRKCDKLEIFKAQLNTHYFKITYKDFA